jgi:tripartite-type tricarboxylate transporter receptor subunit TctC
MTYTRRGFFLLTSSFLSASTFSRLRAAATYPARPVQVIVPYSPGGPSDVVARLIAQKLSEQLASQFYVENVGGAGGNIGVGRAAKATADGYTMLIVSPGYVINPTLYGQVPYDPKTSFDPVTLAVTSTVVLAVNRSVPAKTVNDLVALIKANPGKYSYASPGIGTPGHLVGEQFRLSLDLDIVNVPFKGAGEAVLSAVAGHTLITFAAPAPIVPHLNEGTLRALAVTSQTRLQALRGVPTMAEAGYPDIEFDNWTGVVVPAGTPKEIIAFLNREIGKVVALPEMRERFIALGFDPVGSTPEDFDRRCKVDFDKWRKLIQALSIKPE